MIDQDLINKNSNLIQALFEGRVEFEDSADELYQLLAETNDNYIKLVEQNAELHKELAKCKAIIEDIAALGFLVPSGDSGKSHRDVCEKFAGMDLDV